MWLRIRVIFRIYYAKFKRKESESEKLSEIFRLVISKPIFQTAIFPISLVQTFSYFMTLTFQSSSWLLSFITRGKTFLFPLTDSANLLVFNQYTVQMAKNVKIDHQNWEFDMKYLSISDYFLYQYGQNLGKKKWILKGKKTIPFFCFYNFLINSKVFPLKHEILNF